MASFNPFARTPQSAALDQALFKLQQSAFAQGFYPGGQGYYYLGGRPMVSGTSPIYDTGGKLLYAGTGNSLQGNTGKSSGIGGGGVAGYGDPRNPYFSTQVIHEPEARGIVEQNMRAANETAATGRDALAKAVEDFRALQEPLKASVEKQQNFLADLYDAGGLQSRYDTTLNNFEQASRDLANKSIAAASAHLPTTAGLGSNYLSGLFSRASDAQERLLRDVAAQRLQEEPMLANIRMAALGKDIPLANAYYQSLVSPLITAQQYEQGNLGNILSAIQGLKGTTQSFLGTDSGFQPTISLSTTRNPTAGFQGGGGNWTPSITGESPSDTAFWDNIWNQYAQEQRGGQSRRTPTINSNLYTVPSAQDQFNSYLNRNLGSLGLPTYDTATPSRGVSVNDQFNNEMNSFVSSLGINPYGSDPYADTSMYNPYLFNPLALGQSNYTPGTYGGPSIEDLQAQILGGSAQNPQPPLSPFPLIGQEYNYSSAYPIPRTVQSIDAMRGTESYQNWPPYINPENYYNYPFTQ